MAIREQHLKLDVAQVLEQRKASQPQGECAQSADQTNCTQIRVTGNYMELVTRERSKNQEHTHIGVVRQIHLSIPDQLSTFT